MGTVRIESAKGLDSAWRGMLLSVLGFLGLTLLPGNADRAGHWVQHKV